ncbi:hypothetical protein OTU49_013316, partial [Cherax quadricarinatus]
IHHTKKFVSSMDGIQILSLSEINDLMADKKQIYMGRGVYSSVTMIKLNGEKLCVKTFHEHLLAQHGLSNLLQMSTDEAFILLKLAGAGGAPRLRYICYDYPSFITTCVGQTNVLDHLKVCYPKQCLITLV